MSALIHPPWRTLAEEILRAKDPKQYRELKKSGRLDEYLDDRAEHARVTYEHLAKRLAEGKPELECWAIQAAEELVIHDILDPTTLGELMEDRIPPPAHPEPSRRVQRLTRKAAKLGLTLLKDGRWWSLRREGEPVWGSTRLDEMEKYLDEEHMRRFPRE